MDVFPRNPAVPQADMRDVADRVVLLRGREMHTDH